jgi:rhodanese-related sulfurtransferase
MSRKGRPGATGSGSRRSRSVAAEPSGRNSRGRLWVALAGGAVAVAAFALLAVVVLSGFGSTPGSSQTTGQTVFQGHGGTWTNVTPDRLAQMLGHKDFTFVNVKTPYIGEIDGTDLYIPYDQLTARASQLPQAKDAKILVYCRSGVESAQSAQTLLSLGYTNIWNLDGGMNAWQSSGRTIVQKNR